MEQNGLGQEGTSGEAIDHIGEGKKPSQMDAAPWWLKVYGLDWTVGGSKYRASYSADESYGHCQ